MESIEQMINRLCPEGVTMVKIGDVCKCYAGATPDTKNSQYWENGTIQWMSSGEVNKGQVFATEKKITQLGYDKSSTKMVPINSVVIALAGQGKTRGTVAITRTELCTNQSLCAIIPNEQLIPDFLFHYLKGQYQTLRTISCGDGTRGGLNLKMINAFEIPLPPIEIQNRIVEVLDKMTTLTAELEAELEARKQQYEYYRNKLLTFNGITPPHERSVRQVIWKKISEIAHYPKARIKSEMLTVDTYVGVESLIKDRGGKTCSSSVPEGVAIEFLPQDILIGNIRPYLKKIWLSDCQGGTNGDVVCIRVLDSKEVMPKFLYYILASDAFFDYDNSHAKGGKMPRGDKNAILSYNIPIPSMEEQERIVSILDRFEALTTDLQIGLPAEIEARRQQYEYYRNKLLTFDQAA
ncbi:MAG: restriction endonuclease subunit S [Bacteroidaceae bacterium]|nr:restriction endonuclease subunit S [Bacteroidaceae bacterium]